MTRPAASDPFPRRRLVLEVVGGVRMSEREVQVLGLLQEGLGTGAIAARLGISPVTVRRHSAALQAKLGVRGRKEAIAAAERLSVAPRSPTARQRLALEDRRLSGFEGRFPARGTLGGPISRREAEVVWLMGQGLPTAAIGELLGISPVTVRRHASGLRAKLGARDRGDLLRLLEEIGRPGA
jgi:DNA-binding CsgD family transcriptional regulator